MGNLVRKVKEFDYKLFLSLLLLGFCPTIYTTVRIYFLGQLPDIYSFSIAGQLSWVNLLYEVLYESIILPLFYFMGRVVSDKAELGNRIRSGLLFSFVIYIVMGAVISVFIKPILIIYDGK